jgi:hypothetical protein
MSLANVLTHLLLELTAHFCCYDDSLRCSHRCRFATSSGNNFDRGRLTIRDAGSQRRVFSTVVPELNQVFLVFTAARKPDDGGGLTESNFTKFVALGERRVKEVTEISLLICRMQAIAYWFVCRIFHTAN